MLLISQKLFSFSRYFNFGLDFLVMKKNDLMRLISKLMKQPGKQTLTTLILPNTLRSKSNQTMKFGKPKEYNLRNIFVEKPYAKCGEETISRLFPKKSKLCTSLDQQFIVLYNLFLLCVQVEGYRNMIETKLQTTCFCFI